MDDNEEKQGIPNNAKKSWHTFALFGIWVLFTATVLVIALPIVRESIQQSGVLTLLKGDTGRVQAASEHQGRLWFYTYDGSIREFRQELVKHGGSSYHDTFESLLGGPKLPALTEGAVSSIHPKTTLLGITLSNKVLYIDLSKHFLESRDLKKAYEQLRRTAQGFSQVKDIVLLIGGERATLPGDL